MYSDHDAIKLDIITKDFELDSRTKHILEGKVSDISQLSPFGSTFKLTISSLNEDIELRLDITSQHVQFSSIQVDSDLNQAFLKIRNDLQEQISNWNKVRFQREDNSVEAIEINDQKLDQSKNR